MRLVTCTGNSGLVCEHPALQGDFGVISGRQDWKERAGQPGAQVGRRLFTAHCLRPRKRGERPGELQPARPAGALRCGERRRSESVVDVSSYETVGMLREGGVDEGLRAQAF